MSEAWLERERAGCEERLRALAPAATEPPQLLHQAMRYSLLGGGKRLRPLLCRAAARAVTGSECERAWAPACAVELIHTYSLIHDDLPALDNDDLRRGRPTCHKVFGEATAILAGDALLTLAFEVLAGAEAEPTQVRAMVQTLARAAGTPAGMVAGQAADLEAVRATADLEAVRFIHARKTAALIRASVTLGGLAAAADAAQLAALERFGDAIGLAFQIVDDLLDRRGTAAALGKTAGKDDAQFKATYPAAAGEAEAEAEARRCASTAQDQLAGWGTAAEHLLALAVRMVKRDS